MKASKELLVESKISRPTVAKQWRNHVANISVELKLGWIFIYYVQMACTMSSSGLKADDVDDDFVLQETGSITQLLRKD